MYLIPAFAFYVFHSPFLLYRDFSQTMSTLKYIQLEQTASFIHTSFVTLRSPAEEQSILFFPIPNTHTLNKFLFVASHRVWFCTIDRLAIDFLNIQFWLCLIFLHKNSLPWGLINYSMYGWSVGREGLFFRYQLPFYFSQSYNFVCFLLLLESFWQVLPLYFLHYYY